MSRLIPLAGFALLAGATPAAAQSAPHDGIFVSASAGVGYLHVGIEERFAPVEIRGSGMSYGVAVGLEITPATIVFDRYRALPVSNQEVDADGIAPGANGKLQSLDLGIRHYFMPWNAFVTASLGVTEYSATYNDGIRFGPEWGLGGALEAGWEWRARKDLGVGVAAEVSAARMLPESSIYDWTTTTFSLHVTATYN